MIITDEKLLRQPCSSVTIEESESIINSLELELNNSNRLGSPGIGLAAIQIGIYKTVAIIRIDDIKINLVNPKIIKEYDSFIFENEGCLSFPGKTVKTKRFNKIVVENNVEPYKFIATGLLAVAIQHEVDHLLNILMIDKIVV